MTKSWRLTVFTGLYSLPSKLPSRRPRVSKYVRRSRVPHNWTPPIWLSYLAPKVAWCVQSLQTVSVCRPLWFLQWHMHRAACERTAVMLPVYKSFIHNLLLYGWKTVWPKIIIARILPYYYTIITNDMYQNRDFNKIRIVFGYKLLLYTLVAISTDFYNFTYYHNSTILLYNAGFPLVTSAQWTKK